MAAVRTRGGRLALLALGGAGLMAGLIGALVLLGVPTPTSTIRLAGAHGVLMTIGFLGTLISLERAVALGRAWGYLAPVATGAGGLALVAGLPASQGFGLMTIGAGAFVAMYVAFDRIERSLHTAVQGVGAVAWLGGSVLLLAGWAPPRVFPWLAAFLVLTIAGERLELARLGRLTQRMRIGFVVVAGMFCAGVALSPFYPEAGVRMSGVGMLGMAAWLARNDLARRTVRMQGVTRFVAMSLLTGYAWLAAGGLSWLAFGAVGGGPAYDAMLHTVFLGFVISLVFGHAPIILPAVLGLPLPYRRRFYAHLVLLHAGLLLRLVGGDLLGFEAAVTIGGAINVTAILLFVLSSATAVVSAPRRRMSHSTTPHTLPERP
jgi:hypothetical protein